MKTKRFKWLITVMCIVYCSHNAAKADQLLLEKIANPKISDAELKSALQLLPLERSEQAQKLSRIANSKQYTALHRTRCFCRYWQLMSNEPIPLSSITSDANVREWMKKEHLRDASNFSLLPVKKAPGLTVLMVQPPFAREAHSACYLLLNQAANIETIVESVSKKQATGAVWIIEVGVSIEIDEPE